MAKAELTREEFEEVLGFKIFDWQWEWVKSRANKEKRIQFVPRQNGGRYGFLEGSRGNNDPKPIKPEGDDPRAGKEIPGLLGG